MNMITVDQETLMRMIAQAVEAEREACAKVCERIGNPSNFDYVGVGGVACAEAIRARGNT
jgi:hypothetical protein